MSFLSLNGVDIPVRDGQASRDPQIYGGVANRSVQGAYNSSRRGVKWGGKFKTRMLSVQTANLIEGLVLGRGNTFPFDTSFYSKIKGIAPSSYSGVTLSTSSPKVGTRSAYFASGGEMIYPMGLLGDWTLLMWFKDLATWVHYAIRYDSVLDVLHTYQDLVDRGTLVYNMYSVETNGDLELYGKWAAAGTDTDAYFDSLVVLPYYADTDMIDYHHDSTEAGTLYPAAPQMAMSGDLNREDLTVEGKLGNQSHIQAYDAGAFSDQMRSVSFSLVEV